MTTHLQSGTIRRFRFNPPQRVAATLLALFLAQGLWLATHTGVSLAEAQTLHCANLAANAGADFLCIDRGDGLLAARLAGFFFGLGAGLPLPWQLLLARLPFLFAGLVLGGELWWVARRLFGNRGGYLALTLYCFSPAMVALSATASPEILAALALYAGVYTCIGVAHAMQGPRRKWKPRIVLLAAILLVALAAHVAVLLAILALGLGLMLWIAEGRRVYLAPALAISTALALVGAFLLAGCNGTVFLSLFHLPALPVGVSWRVLLLFLNLQQAGFLVLLPAAVALFLLSQRSRYFGNFTPLLTALLLLLALPLQGNAAPCVWAIPFLLTCIGGVFADAFEEAHGRRWEIVAVSLTAIQAALCLRFVFA